MKILALESSAVAASCAAYIDGRLCARSWQDAGLTHSRTLMPMVRDMLRNSGLDIHGFDVVAVSHGPGSFTGVRIGVATALGIAEGIGARAVGVSTLEAMARLLTEGGVLSDAVTLAAMDARRGEVYAAAFLGETRLMPDTAAPAPLVCVRAAEFAKKTGKPIICVGDGAEICYNYLKEMGEDCRLAPPHLLRQDAAGVAFAAAALMESGGEIPSLRPVYLRLSQAERERLEREKAAAETEVPESKTSK